MSNARGQRSKFISRSKTMPQQHVLKVFNNNERLNLFYVGGEYWRPVWEDEWRTRWKETLRGLPSQECSAQADLDPKASD